MWIEGRPGNNKCCCDASAPTSARATRSASVSVVLLSYCSGERGISQSVMGSIATACALLIELCLLDQLLDLFIPPPGRSADITRHQRALWMHVEAGRGKRSVPCIVANFIQ